MRLLPKVIAATRSMQFVVTMCSIGTGALTVEKNSQQNMKCQILQLDKHTITARPENNNLKFICGHLL